MTDETATLSLAPSLDPPCSLLSSPSLARFSFSLSLSLPLSMHYPLARTHAGERKTGEGEREKLFRLPHPTIFPPLPPSKNSRSFVENFQPLITFLTIEA